MLDNRFTTLKFNLHKKHIYDYKDVLRENFKNEKKYISSYFKKEAALCLLKIIPKKNEKEEEKVDNQERQRELFYLYKTITQENCDFTEIDRNDSNENIWLYANSFIYEIIKEKIEEHENIDLLAKYLNKSKEETINLIKSFIKFSDKGKIITNQNYKLCKKNELYNEGQDDKEFIPEELKDISKILGFDIRNSLAHESMERLCLNNYSYKQLCLKIDELMTDKYKDSNNFSDENFKTAANNLIEEYFDKIGKNNAKIYFPKTFLEQEGIILNVIYNKDMRKNVAEIGKKYGSEIYDVLLRNPIIMKYIINNELNDSNYNPDLLEKLNFINDDFDSENPINRKTGISGEAYIYELLLESNKYKNVKWLMLNETEKGELFEYNGKKYYITQDYSHYDILVETNDNNKLYIEVKSTKAKFGNKIPFYISEKQIQMMNSIKYPDKYILALVFDVMSNPKHFFMELYDI